MTSLWRRIICTVFHRRHHRLTISFHCYSAKCLRCGNAWIEDGTL